MAMAHVPDRRGLGIMEVNIMKILYLEFNEDGLIFVEQRGRIRYCYNEKPPALEIVLPNKGKRFRSVIMDVRDVKKFMKDEEAKL